MYFCNLGVRKIFWNRNPQEKIVSWDFFFFPSQNVSKCLHGEGKESILQKQGWNSKMNYIQHLDSMTIISFTYLDQMCVCDQSCPTLSDSADCSPPGYSVHWISQVRVLEGFAISFSRASSWPRDGPSLLQVKPLLLRTWKPSLAWIALLFFKVGGRGKNLNTAILELLNTVRC